MNSDEVLSTLLALHKIIEKKVLRELTAAQIPASTVEFAPIVFLLTRRN
jgi:hypothetical protein